MLIKTRLQLSTLMFLQYFVWGTWYVTITTYVTTTLEFTPVQAGFDVPTVSPEYIGTQPFRRAGTPVVRWLFRKIPQTSALFWVIPPKFHCCAGPLARRNRRI